MNLKQALSRRVRARRSHRIRPLIVAPGVLALLLAAPAGSRAQSTKDEADGWSFMCARPPFVAHDECGLIRSVVDADRAGAGMTLAVIRKPGVNGYTVRFVAPLGVLLTKKLSVRLDDKDLGQLGFLRCFSSGCVAQVQDTGFIDRMKVSSVVHITIFETPGASITFPVELSGLASSLQKSLPLE